MSVINTNISATIASNAIIRNDRAMGTAMERLSTGLRINSAKDDAAGLAIASRMTATVSGLEMAAKNANDAISMLEVAEGATLEISNMLIRMRELAVQSASGTYSDTDRDAMDLEFGALMSEIDRIATNTTWNTMSILDGVGAGASTAVTTVTIQLGAGPGETMPLTFKSWKPSSSVDSDGTGVAADAPNVSTHAFGTAALQYGAGPTSINVDTAAAASNAISQLDKAILGASAERANYGAYMSRLEHSSDNLLNVAQNTAEPKLLDASGG
jgi:flagellin